MRPAARHLAVARDALFVFALLAATRAAAQTTTWVVPPVALDDRATPELLARLGDVVDNALAARAELTLVQLARNAGAPDLTAARAALAAARDDYQKFQFGASEHELERAVDLVTRAGVPAGEAQTLVDALIELATVEDASGRHADAVRACESLMVLRPNVTLDPVRVPPRVIQTCEAARRRRSAVVRSVGIRSTPPACQLYVDGQPFGATPATVTLPAGTHYLQCVGRDQQTAARTVEIEPGSAPAAVHLALPEPPSRAPSEALRARLRQRGPRAETLAAAAALAAVTSVQRVVVAAVERDAPDRWRLWLAAIDPQRRTEPIVVVAAIADDLADAAPVMTRMAAALVAPRAHGGPTRVGDVGAAVGVLDFGPALFGKPPGAIDVRAASAAERAPARSRKATWLWIGGAVVVAGAALATGLLVGLDNGKLRVSY